MVLCGKGRLQKSDLLKFICSYDLFWGKFRNSQLTDWWIDSRDNTYKKRHHDGTIMEWCPIHRNWFRTKNTLWKGFTDKVKSHQQSFVIK